MTRPRYETADDRKREASAISRMVLGEGETARKMEQGAFADYELFRGNTRKAYVEVKTRRCPSTQYGTYHISKAKLTTLSNNAKRAGVKAMLLVEWTDRAGYIDVDRALAFAAFKTGGRYDRNDPHDVEVMADFPINLFTFLP